MTTTRDTRDMTAEELAAEGITVAEAVGKADNGGRKLSMLIEMGMHEAADQVRAKGIADDTPPHKVAEILGTDPATETREGCDVIREAKQAARVQIRQTFAKEEEERRAAVEAKLRGADAEG